MLQKAAIHIRENMATQTRWFLELSRVTKASTENIINITKQMKKDINNFSE